MPAPAQRSLHVQPICTHDDFHGISSCYDRRRRILSFVLTCERCGVELRELRRERYSPRYDPHGNDRYLAAAPDSAKGRPSGSLAPGT